MDMDKGPGSISSAYPQFYGTQGAQIQEIHLELDVNGLTWADNNGNLWLFWRI